MNKTYQENNLISQQGFVYMWALFAIVVAGIVMAGTGQVWLFKSQREKETELLFIGEEFRKAFMSYYEGSPGGAKQYPETLEDLLDDKRMPAMKRHLRKIYVDPLTNSTEWGIVEEPPPVTGQGISTGTSKRIIGVYSLSEKPPIKADNFSEHFAKFSEATTYQEWQFVYKPGDNQTPANPTSTTSPLKPNETKPTTAGNASPFSPQPSSPANSKAPTTGFASPQ